MSYIFARVLADFHAWKGQFLENTTLAAAFTVLFAILARCVPMLVPTFLAVMSFPPFVDPVNLFFLKHVLLLGQHKDQSLHPARRSDGRDRARTGSDSITSVCDNDHVVASELAEILGVRAEFEDRMWRKQNATCNPRDPFSC
mmetsp:Transcript_107148/g.207626  ORF Transcript_107148/g.207626 Transcript_107148/m.207626 type:complete len:143 (-) Transcript_107148:24-452(-)